MMQIMGARAKKCEKASVSEQISLPFNLRFFLPFSSIFFLFALNLYILVNLFSPFSWIGNKAENFYRFQQILFLKLPSNYRLTSNILPSEVYRSAHFNLYYSVAWRDSALKTIDLNS